MVFFGVLGFFIEFSKHKPSLTNFSGYAVALSLFACGVTICVATWLRYHGGPWSFFGIVMVAAAACRFGFASEIYLRGKFLLDPNSYLIATCLLCGVGCYCLIWGHLRKRHALQKTDGENLLCRNDSRTIPLQRNRR